MAAQFTIAKYWKQPKCPSANEWIQKLWYIYTMEFYAAERKKELIRHQKSPCSGGTLATKRAKWKGQDRCAFPLPEESALLTVKPGGPAEAAF